MAAGSGRVKLLVDECIGKITVRTFAALFLTAKPPVEVVPFLDWVGGLQGIKDDEWVPRAKAEGWFVITGDRGVKKDGPPLHILLPTYGVSAAFMTGKIQSATSFVKAASIIALWEEIRERAIPAPPGTRFKIGRKFHGYALSPWPMNEVAKQQKTRLIQDIPPHLFAKQSDDEP